jgi:hypothetical protein
MTSATSTSPQIRPAGHAGGRRRARDAEATDAFDRRQAYDGDGVMINSRFLDGMTPKRRLTRIRASGLKRKSWQCRVRRAQGELPPARLGHFAPALLGLPDPGHPLREPAASCRCRRRICRSSCRRTSTFDKSGNPLDRHPTWKHVDCPQCGKAGAARDRHDGHVRRFVLVLRPLHRAVDEPTPTDRRRPNTGCRSTSISAASSTRSCICSIRASSPAR